MLCRNEEQARRDQAVREEIVAKLKAKLGRGAKELVGNRGFRRYLEARGEGFVIDEESRRRGALRRAVGVAGAGGFECGGGGAAVQAAVAGGALLPRGEVAAADAAGVPPHGRGDPRARVLLVPGAGAEAGAGAAHAGGGHRAEWADVVPRSGAAVGDGGGVAGQAVRGADAGAGAVAQIVRCVGASLPPAVRREDAERRCSRSRDTGAIQPGRLMQGCPQSMPKWSRVVPRPFFRRSKLLNLLGHENQTVEDELYRDRNKVMTGTTAPNCVNLLYGWRLRAACVIRSTAATSIGRSSSTTLQTTSWSISK